MYKQLMVCLLVISVCLPQAAVAIEPVRTIPEFVGKTESSRAWINWSDFVIRATARGGENVSADKAHTPYDAMAKARQEAYRLLLQTGKSVQLTAAQTVGAYLEGDDELLAQFENVSKKAAVTGIEFLSTGPVEVTLELPMTGAFASLVLPDAVTRLEEIEAGQTSSDTDGSAYTGLVVDARGIAVRPALCFQLVNEDGKEVYGPAYASREHVVAKGMGQYVPGLASVEENPRIGDNPLIIKAIRVHPPGGSTLVISDTDASRLRSSVEHLAFLKRCRVVVVVGKRAKK
jgi:hypothetical protein